MGINIGLDKIKSVDLWRAVIAEFVGSALFLLCVTCVALSSSSSDVSASNVAVGVGIGLSFTSLTFAVRHVSGGHLNPVVSLGMMVAEKISVIQGLLYIVAQLVGGIAGSALTYACIPETVHGDLGATVLNAGVKPGLGLVLELFFTFFLVFFIFSITDEKKNVDSYGTNLGVGVVTLVCHVCLLPFTGCGINPARSFGPAVVMNVWTDHWVYWIGPIIGAIFATVVYKFVFPVPEDKPDAENTDILMTETENTA